jgi:hypothetical protein
MVGSTTTFPTSFPSLTHNEEELLNASMNVDFAKIFEDEFNDVFVPDQQSHQPQQQVQQSFDNFNMNGGSSYNNSNNNTNNQEITFSMNGSVNSNQVQGVFQAQQQAQQDLVNVMLIVDPNTNKVICPPQMLSLNYGGDVKSTFFNGANGFTMEQLAQLRQLSNNMQGALQQSTNTSATNPSLPGARAGSIVPTPLLPYPTSTNTTQVFPPVSESNEAFAAISDSESSYSRNQLQHPILAPMPTLVNAMGPPSPAPSAVSSSGTAVTASTAGGVQGDLPPLRSLSAYNFFFRDERDRILHGGEHEWTSEKQKKLLADHWQRDRTKKRRHRKTHGKIDFTTLSKLISQRWKELDESKKAFYRQVAAQDWERYQRELNQYKMQESGKNSAPVAVNPFQFQPVIG